MVRQVPLLRGSELAPLGNGRALARRLQSPFRVVWTAMAFYLLDTLPDRLDSAGKLDIALPDWRTSTPVQPVSRATRH